MYPTQEILRRLGALESESSGGVPAILAGLAFVDVKAYGALGNGAHDDTSDFQNAVDTTAPLGKAVWMSAGAYDIVGYPVLPSKTLLWGDAAALIAGTGPVIDPVYSSPLTIRPTADPSGNSGTVTVNATVGADTIEVTMTSKPAGKLLFQHGATASEAMFDVVSAVASGPNWIVMLDRPNVWPFVAGDTVVQYLDYTTDVTIIGNGMRLSGVADQVIEAVAAKRFSVSGLRYTTETGQVLGTPFGFDVACQQVVFSGWEADQGPTGTPSTAAFFVANERSVCRNGTAKGGGAAVALLDCYATGTEDCWSYNATDATTGAFLIGAQTPGSSFGCIDCWISGGGVVDTAGSGYQIEYSTGSLLENVSVRGAIYGVNIGRNAVRPTVRSVRIYTVTTGVNVDSSCVDFTGEDITVSGASTNGVTVPAGAKGTRLRSLYIDGCINASISVSDDFVLDNLECVQPSSATGADAIIVAGGRFQNSETSLLLGRSEGNGFHVTGGSSTIQKARVTCAAADQTAFYLTGGTVYLANCSATGPGTSYGVYVAGATLHIGPGCDFDGTANPFTGGATVTMDQTGGVASVPGTSSLTFAQHYNTSIELAAGAAGDATITTYAIPGMVWACRNPSAHNLILKTSTAATVTVGAGKSASVCIDAAGDMIRLSPDT